VISEGEAIRDLYPDYVETGSVYEFLANAWTAKGDKAKAMGELARYAEAGGREPQLLDQLASLQTERGQKREAAKTLDRLNMIYLGDDAAHQKLGDLDLDLGNAPGAIREYQAVLAGKPIDPAAAHYGLARAYLSAKRTADAREEVISALEAAPGFKPAQKLLLELNGKE
jgi:tetratricopeptide (TPR) repeat protein